MTENAKECAKMVVKITQGMYRVIGLVEGIDEIEVPVPVEKLEERVRMDLTYFALRTLDKEKPLQPEVVEFMNQCFEDPLDITAYERLREKAAGDDVADLFVLFPFLLEVDDALGGG